MLAKESFLFRSNGPNIFGCKGFLHSSIIKVTDLWSAFTSIGGTEL